MQLLPHNDVRPSALAASLIDLLREGACAFGLEDLENLESKLTATLSVVRGNINNHRPIHRLPVEILGIIFRYALPPENGRFRQSGFREPDMAGERRAQISIIHVCRQWRAVALGTPSLWTMVDTSSGSWASRCLEYSGAMPLHVFMRYPLDKTTEIPLVPQGSRIRNLFLELPRDHRSLVPTELPAFLPHVPNLECLVITTRCRQFEEGRPMIDPEQCPPLFPQPPPRLTTLILKNQCWLPAIPYEHLTHLHIAQGTPVDLRALLALLRRCIALEALVLADIYLANARAAATDAPPASLPRLRLLTIGITQSRLSMRYLLPTLILPPSATVRVVGMEVPAALLALQPFPRLTCLDGADALSIACIAGADPARSVRLTGPLSGGLFLDFQNSNGGAAHESFLGAIVAPLAPFTHIARLAVRANQWNFNLPVLPALLSLRLVEVPSPHAAAPPGDVCRAMCAWLERAVGRNAFPELRELEMWAAAHRVALEWFQGQLPSVKPPKLESVTVYRVGHEDPSPPHTHASDSIPGVELRIADVADLSASESPSTRPLRHAYDWELPTAD